MSDMAKATVTFEDNDDGTVSVAIEFDPEVHADDEMTPAQYMAFRALQTVTEIE